MLGLHLLGLAETHLRFGLMALLVQGFGQKYAITHSQKRITAAISVDHGLLGVCNRLGHFAQRQLQLTQVGGAFCHCVPR